MNDKPLIENIEHKNEVLYNAIRDIADWWAKNVNYLGNKIGHYNITALDLEEGVYDIYDTVMKSYILFPISSHIQNKEYYYTFYQQVKFLSDFMGYLSHDIRKLYLENISDFMGYLSHDIRKLYLENIDIILSLFEPYKNYIDTKENKQQTKKEN